MSSGSTGKSQSPLTARKHLFDVRTSVCDFSPHMLLLLPYWGHNGNQCAWVHSLSYVCQKADKLYWIKPPNMLEMDISRDSYICFLCRERRKFHNKHWVETTWELLIHSWALTIRNKALIRREHSSYMADRNTSIGLRDSISLSVTWKISLL